MGWSVEFNWRSRNQLVPTDTWFFDKEAKTIQWKKERIFNNWCWFNWMSSCRSMKIDPYLSPCTKLMLGCAPRICLSPMVGIVPWGIQTQVVTLAQKWVYSATHLHFLFFDMYVQTHTYTCIYIYMYVYIHIHTYTYTFMYIYLYLVGVIWIDFLLYIWIYHMHA